MVDIQQQAVTEDLNRLVREVFTEYATSIVGYSGIGEPIAFVATDEDTFVGMVIVELLWGGLHVKYLYVEEDYRDRGIGSQLMERAHTFGKQQNCSFAWLESMSYWHALEFYQKLGYCLEFTREGYAEGLSLYYLQKKI